MTAETPTSVVRWGGGLVCLTFAAYVIAMTGGWIWDDDDHVTRNETLQSLDGLRRIWLEPGATPQYYPLVFTTFWLERAAWGLNATYYHVANVALHAANALLAWRILRRLQIPGAWLAAAVFAVHPVHVESVAWVTERKNVLSGLFYLLAMAAYLRFDASRGGRWYLAALGAFLAALLSKTVTCTLPAALAVLLCWRRGRITRGDLARLAPFFVLGVGFGLFTVWVEKNLIGAAGADWELTPTQRVVIAGRAAWFYAGKLAWPTPLIFIYPRWQVDPTAWHGWLFPLGVCAAVAALWLARRRLGAGPLVAALLFLGTLFPALGFFDVYPFRYSFVADHFQYLASVPLLALAVAAGSAVLERWPRIAQVSAGVLLTVLAVLTLRQSTIYYSEETLWRDTLAKNDDCAIAHARLGILLAGRQNYLSAAEHFVEVVRRHPKSVADQLRLAQCYAFARRPDQAEEVYRAVLALDAESLPGHAGLAEMLARQQRWHEAATQFLKATRLDPADPDLQNALGMVYAQLGQWDRAVAAFEAALRLRPDHELARQNLETARRAPR